MGTLQSQFHGVGRSIVWERQGWSSSILERKLTAHATAISSSRRVCCLTSEQYVVMQVDTAAGWSASAHRPDHDGLAEKNASTSLNLTCGLRIALILIQWIMLFGVLFSNESTTNDNSRRWKN